MNKNSEDIEKIVNDLENLGEVSINDGSKELFIQAVDDKEGYSYVSSTNREFKNSREAADWAADRMNKYE